MIGQKFHRLTVIEDSGIRKHQKVWWRCLCDCGNETIVATSYLRSGHTKSCGCGFIEKCKQGNLKHGMRWSRAYTIWSLMKKRCDDPKCKAYKNYGGRGISYDPSWRKFENFFADMGDPPLGTELDRRDNMSGYSKNNCRWVSRSVNARNKRVNRYVQFGAENLCLKDWTNKLGISQPTPYDRARKQGITPEQWMLNYLKDNYKSQTEA